MERITELIEKRWVAVCKREDIKLTEFQINIINRLAEYENTELTPKEIKQLQKENEELKSRLEKSVELLKIMAESNINNCDMCKNIYDSPLCDVCGKYGRSHYECKHQDEFNELIEEAEQALKGCANNE